MGFELSLLPKEIRQEIYYQYLLQCKRSLSCMAVGYNQWPTPMLLLTSGYSDQEHLRVSSETPYPLELENFMLAAPHTESPYRQTYGSSPESLTNLMCVSRSTRQEAEAVLYQRFIFCFHNGLYPKAASRFLSEVSANALPQITTLAFLLRYDDGVNWNKWKRWEENCQILSRGFTGIRAVFFEIQVLDETAGHPLSLDLQGRHDIAVKLLEVTQSFTDRHSVQVRWVGVRTGKVLADLCHQKPICS